MAESVTGIETEDQVAGGSLLCWRLKIVYPER